jgi:hypothetical protein
MSDRAGDATFPARDCNRRAVMLDRGAIGAMALAAMLCAASGAWAFDDAKYPDLHGQWIGVRGTAGGGQPSFDPIKRWGTTQDAPLTAEYKAMFEANLVDQRDGGQGTNATSTCLAPGMPMVMNAHSPMEIIVLPETTYFRVDHIRDTHRRIYTDGRDWPAQIEPGFDGYSIGRWIDTKGDGHYDLLEVETRGFKGPRAYDASGQPLHLDNQSVFMERIYRDKADPKILHDQITVLDHALTRPWIVDKKYVIESNPRPEWSEAYCTENPSMIAIGKESYFLSGDGMLMPVRKDQPAPDLRYFKQTRK